MFCGINEALDWIMKAHKGQMTYERFKEICTGLNNPQNSLKIIHVAGTNGKGSTVTFLRDLLVSQGFKVGTLQSPHYLTHLDRIRLNGNNITDEAFLRILNKNYDFFVENNLGMFEMDYLIMCEYFLEEKVDYAIVEVGIGGRLDSTNVVDNTLLSIITNIGLDHTEMLGDSLESICLEKCGIIKNDSNVVIGYLEDNLSDLVKDVCENKNSNFYQVKEYKDLGNREFEYEDRKYSLLSFGKYQMANASLALEALNVLSEIDNFEIDYELAKKAISKSIWQGRFEVVNENPRVILDGAHNTHGIKALVSSFDELEGTKCIIFSALKRKDYQKMCEILKEHTDKLVITKFDYQGSIDLDDLDVEYKDIDYKHAIKTSIEEFDNTLICGSLYFISEVAQMMKGVLEDGK